VDEVPNVGVLMFVAHRELERRALSALHEAGFEITMAQARLAARLTPEGMRLTRLAESARVTKQTAGVLVDQLERHGYVERVPDPTDARARLVRTAPLARDMVEVANQATSAVLAEWTVHLGEDDMLHLHTTLSRLREITDPYA
jgi:DNA-binding MarR family transcriptional regulator